MCAASHMKTIEIGSSASGFGFDFQLITNLPNYPILSESRTVCITMGAEFSLPHAQNAYSPHALLLKPGRFSGLPVK